MDELDVRQENMFTSGLKMDSEVKPHISNLLQKMKSLDFIELCSLPQYNSEKILILGKEITFTTMMYHPNSSRVAIAVRSDENKFMHVAGYTEGFWKHNDQRVTDMNSKDIQECFE